MQFWAYIILVPVVLLALWAAYLLIAHRSENKPGGTGREDRTEPRELTGPEQQKHHHPA